MALFDVLFLLLVIFAGIAGLVMWQRMSQRSRFIGGADPSAGINPNDSTAAARTKSKNFHRVVEAVRIFNEIQHQDRLVPILDDSTRAAVQAFLDDYYKDN